MSEDDDFEPRLGRMRSPSGRRGVKYLNRVLAATILARGGAGGLGRAARGFTGSRIGRGAGVGRVLAARDQFAAYRQRRVIIKSRIVKLAGKGSAGARAHLRYIQRDGVSPDGQPGRLYGAEHDQVDGRAFLDRAEGDRQQFRFIVSAEDGDQYEDLKPLVRRLMAQMEEDLGTRLDWVAVDHHNTGHPHSHIIVRGKDDRGKDLVIAREYMAVGMRERAAEIVSLDLGPRTDLEIKDQLRREVERDRLTSIDRRLLRDVGADGQVGAADRSPFHQALRVGRLRKLERMGLADEVRPGHWHLADDLEATLRELGKRGDIVKTMHREMAARDQARAPADLVIHSPVSPQAAPITGRIVARGLADELNDRRYLIIDATDGRTHYVDIGRGEAIEPLPEGGVVRIQPRHAETRKTDHTVVEVAAASGGRYSVDLHLRHDLSAKEAYAETHVRRLEAIRRVTGAVEREPDGTWIIAPNHLDQALAYEQKQVRAMPVTVQVLSALPLDRQIGADGATWLDREMASSKAEPLREAGFGQEVREAQARRRQWLIAEGLVREEEDRETLRPGVLTALRRRELQRVAGQLSDELGLGYVELRSGQPVEGTLRRLVSLSSDKIAVIERSCDFTLVPWRPVLDGHVGQQVSGVLRGDGISWAIGRQRGGPAVE
ncbi:type IV secretory pathway VirD2 relaxase [Nitrospirillum amazonense]|uniref:Type IV secretory pathway VirD2 relaxase n=1 Tax=Nitrospirillum amazonense TaxID=28077 RepID=A0A560K1H2_9PROT|nr:relaxase/mobilization nuclease RlxS [Nitrospirillum amazonense]TWB77195.1 type IV secretory pathway VirD2 relaxase [Nitrospirillum amazonense]